MPSARRNGIRSFGFPSVAGGVGEALGGFIARSVGMMQQEAFSCQSIIDVLSTKCFR
jgi:hypothetical protein